MALRDDVFGQLRIPDDPVARYEKGRDSPMLFQQPQQFGSGQLVRAVIEGKGDGLSAACPATDHRQEKTARRDERGGHAQEHEHGKGDNRQPEIDPRQKGRRKQCAASDAARRRLRQIFCKNVSDGAHHVLMDS
jgi:hypothetical protein